jgi:hypothetical protein
VTRVTFNVPLALNDGTPVPYTNVAQYEADILRIAGGYTRTSAGGAWLAPDGTVYRDDNLLYTVDTGSEDTVDALRILAALIAAELGQEAVYFTTAEVNVEYIAGVPA